MSQKFKGNVRIDGSLTVPAQTASTVLVTDASKNVISSAVTSAELANLSGITSNIQDQLDDKINLSEKGAVNGVATLDAGGKVPVSQLPSSVMEFKGTWDASTNTPTLADGVGDTGDVYLVSVAGTQDLGSGPISFAIGDWAIYNGTIWQKSLNSNAVVSVNGQQGVVVLDTDDIDEGSLNLYFTDERAQDAVGTILTDSSSIDFTYNDGGPTITAAVLPAGVDHDQLQNFVANEHVDHSAVSILTPAGTSGLTGGGDITASRTLSVDINGTTAETSADNADKILIYDSSATALRSQTRAQFLAGVAVSNPTDINETLFAGANNQTTPADVTGFEFDNAQVRSFTALVSIAVDATTPLNETYELIGIQKAGSWEIAQKSVGDDSLVLFSIDNAGQIQYTSGNYTGFTALEIKFRALTLTV